ncbi:MAG: hypothetical protein WCU80_05530 [Paludibacteraceae bacterium]
MASACHVSPFYFQKGTTHLAIFPQTTSKGRKEATALPFHGKKTQRSVSFLANNVLKSKKKRYFCTRFAATT